MLVTSIFFFSDNVFKMFSLLGSLKLKISWQSVGSLRYNKILELVQIEIISSRNIKFDSKTTFPFWKGGKHCGERRKMPISSFAYLIRTMFSYAFFPTVPLSLSKTTQCFTWLLHKSFENTVGKGEIARNEQFLLFPQCFLFFLRTFRHFH